MAKKTDLWGSVASFWTDAKPVLHSVWTVIREIASWAFKLRSVILSIPVAIGAIYLAIRNMALLPAEVGLNLLETGEYGMTVGRGVAVMGPLAITALSLLLMFCSRKTLYPWLISLFTLTLPIIIWVINVFPA